MTCSPWNVKGDGDSNDILLYVKLIEKLQTSGKTLLSLSAEIIETTEHIDFSLGAFLRAQLEVGFLQHPVVTSNSHWSDSLQGEFCFPYLRRAAGSCLPPGVRASPGLPSQCARVALLPMETKASFGGGRALCKGKMENKPIGFGQCPFESVFDT